MSKIIQWILVGAIVLVGGYYAFNSSQYSKEIIEEEKVVENTNTDTENEAPAGKKIAFSQLIAQDKTPYECTVNQYVNNTESKGKVYIDNGRLNAEFNTKVAGLSIDSTLIVKDGYTYSWSSALPGTGFKAKATVSEGNTNTGTSGQYSFNAEQIGDYDCKIWTVDEAKFTLPLNVTFKEV